MRIKHILKKLLQLPLGNSFPIMSYNTLTNDFHFNTDMWKPVSSKIQFFTLKGSGENATQDLTFCIDWILHCVAKIKGKFPNNFC